MRAVYLIAGAGGMYCGACLRDNRLAVTLLSQGRDFLLLPLYTPIRTDEEDVSRSPVLFGGISAFLEERFAFFRKPLPVIDRILDSGFLLRFVSRLASATNPADLGPLTVSVLRGPDGHQAKEVDRVLSTLAALKPDVVNLPNLMLPGLAKPIRDALDIPIVCTLAGEDIFLDVLREPYRRQAFDLIAQKTRYVDAFVSPTQYYAAHAATHFGLPFDSIHVIPMGVRVEDFDTSATSSDRPFTIGFLARICHDKGLHILADAFIEVARQHVDCRLHVAGYVGAADRSYYKQIRDKLADAGLADRCSFVGEVDRDQKCRFLSQLHVLSVPTVYHESKGQYLIESFAAGVPAIQPRKGSFPELIEPHNTGILYNDDTPSALAAAISDLIADPAKRQTLATNARHTARTHHTDIGMADKTWALYESIK